MDKFTVADKALDSAGWEPVEIDQALCVISQSAECGRMSIGDFQFVSRHLFHLSTIAKNAALSPHGVVRGELPGEEGLVWVRGQLTEAACEKHDSDAKAAIERKLRRGALIDCEASRLMIVGGCCRLGSVT
jgi:hypothetical protein